MRLGVEKLASRRDNKKIYIYIYTHHSPCSIESPLLNSRNRQSLLLEKKITRLIHAATRRLQRPLPHDNRRGVISRWRKGSLLLLRRRKPASRLVGSALLGSTLTFQFPRFISSVRAWCTGCTLGKERSLVIFLPSFFICVYIYIYVRRNIPLINAMNDRRGRFVSRRLRLIA